jgi:cobalt/nickel transport system permease protein
MHIPDGMLSNATVAVTGVASLGYVGYGVAWIRKHFDQRKVVLMAVTAALIFALQMLNFPVAAGTSGHFAGGALAAILLGPFAAGIVMTTVLLIQAVVFADGGILALGANVFNLAVVAPLVGWGTWRLFLSFGDSKALKVAGAFVASWVSLVVASIFAAIEIWISGNAQILVVLGAMGFWHAIIGIGEGIITAGLVAYVLQVRPDLLTESAAQGKRGIRNLAIGFAVFAIVAAGISFLASGSPDGLEFVYFEQGVGAEFEEMALLSSPIPDYVVPGLSNETLAGILAGIVGVIITGVLLYAFGVAVRNRDTGSR